MNNAMLAASVTCQGARHARNNNSNEDSVYFKMLPSGRGIVAAVSDGAGSASRAKEGSHLAATYAVKRAFQAILEEEADPAFAVATGFMAARQAIRQRAEIIPEAEMADYHCTLILVAWVEDQVAAIQVGDGAAIVESDGVCKMLTVPQRGEYVNETFFITEPHYEQTKFTREATGITALALFTDGLQKDAVDFQHRKANDDFIPQAITILRNAETGNCPPEKPDPLLAEVETKSVLAQAGSISKDMPPVGINLFEWLTEQVGHPEDDMSLIVAARRRSG